MRPNLKAVVAGLVCVTGVFGIAITLHSRKAIAQAQSQQAGIQKEVIGESNHDQSPLLRSIPPVTRPAGPVVEIPLLPGPQQTSPAPQASPGSAAQSPTTTTAPLAVSIGLNFDGILADGTIPPDANGAPGDTQFVEVVNSSMAVYSKSSGTLLYGPVYLSTLWSGFGGACGSQTLTDPIVKYDQLANVWIIAAFTHAGTPYTYCLAVSTSSDATGSYYRYAYSFNYEPDYPKLGIWVPASGSTIPDYFISFNMYTPNGVTYYGPKVCALNRQQVLGGGGASLICYQQTNTNYFTLLPSDLDGSTPAPAGSPDYLVGLSSNGNGLDYFKFYDYGGGTTSFYYCCTLPDPFPQPEICIGGYGVGCVPQPGTSQQLDGLGNRLMYRQAYRNYGSYEASVIVHSVQGSGSESAVRWYMMHRTPSRGWYFYQAASFDPDTDNWRWMGSAAEDKVEDVALGFSLSSQSLNYPSVFITGRMPTDAQDTMEQETPIVHGSGYQTGTYADRWGDYSSMAIDPTDDCTFWYTNEYLAVKGGTFWSTRIGNFKFSDCQ
jgi:hypothetical protein